jgi:hypothetical protein
MELAPIMLSVSIFANLLAKIQIKSENKQNEGEKFAMIGLLDKKKPEVIARRRAHRTKKQSPRQYDGHWRNL